jgi:hypothetical protein
MDNHEIIDQLRTRLTELEGLIREINLSPYGSRHNRDKLKMTVQSYNITHKCLMALTNHDFRTNVSFSTIKSKQY